MTEREDARADTLWRERLRGGPLSHVEEEAFAAFALTRVSRTFALNIRVLPEPLRGQVLHAYLYCRMADTIEDDATLPGAQRSALLHAFAALFEPDSPPDVREAMARAIPALLPEAWRIAEDWESVLLNRTPAMLGAFSRLPEPARRATADCVREMCAGMAGFAMRQEEAARGGRRPVETLEELDRYCWYVAGTVGVMLCELFVEHAGIRGDRASAMRARCVSFGTGLQLVNILKDRLEDRGRGVSWLPASLEGSGAAPLFAKTLKHLEEAVEYTLAIPRRQRRLRLFCLWPLLMAAETLALLAEETGPRATGRTKITRARVTRIVARSSLLWWSDGWLRAEFARSAQTVRAALTAFNATAAAPASLHEAPPADTFDAS
jgi:farnesyl-diphosphate farnesyltransferase